jgi:signal transduction histidine kinase
LARGYDGLRLTGDTLWLEKTTWRDFTDYEAALDRTTSQARIKAICTYSLDKCQAAEIIDVVKNHGYTLIKRGEWELIENAQRKRAEEKALEKAMAELEKMVQARTAELQDANQKLLMEIAERKRVEEQLRASREQLRALAAYLQSVREEERSRIARELHDEVGQGLTGIKLSLERSTGQPSDAVRANLSPALASTNELIGRVRDLSLDLRPAMLDDIGLLAALTWHFDRYNNQARITVDFKHTGLVKRRFEPKIETAAYRIVKNLMYKD